MGLAHIHRRPKRACYQLFAGTCVDREVSVSAISRLGTREDTFKDRGRMSLSGFIVPCGIDVLNPFRLASQGP